MIIFEQHNGKDIKRAIQQMLQHCEHLKTHALKQQYQLVEDPTIVYVFEHEKLIVPVMKRIQSEPKLLRYLHCFILETQSSIESLGFHHYYIDTDINS